MGSPQQLTAYELMVKKNIEDNRTVLQRLGLLDSVSDVKSRPIINRPKPKPIKPQKLVTPKQENEEVQDNQPIRRLTRRSSAFLHSIGCDDFNDSSYINNEENTPPYKKIKIKHEPVFGEVEGVNVGDWWQTRLECSEAGIHRPTVAGIHGKQGEGCYSIALSGGYEDDLDCGNCFTYTGCGGRDLKGTKANPKNLRTAKQSKDQVLDGLNAALASNVESNKPVRVIRGYKLQSPYAPEEGYRYDGLYSVEKYWTATGLSGFKVFKFALKRLSGQEPAPWESSPLILSPGKNQLFQTPIRRSVSKEKISCKGNKATSPFPEVKKHSPKEPSEQSGNKTSNSSSKIPRIKEERMTEECDKNDSGSGDKTGSQSGVNNKIINNLKNKGGNSNSKSSPTMVVKPSLKRTLSELDVDDDFENPIKILKIEPRDQKKAQTAHEVELNFDQSLITTPVTNRRNSCLKHNDSIGSETLCSTPQLSAEKKVRFSPKVIFTDDEGNDSIRPLDLLGTDSCSCVDEAYDSPGDSISAGKKQTSILKYFSPIKKSTEPQAPKSIVNPKSLRGNRFSSFSTISLLVQSNSQNKKKSPKDSEKNVNGIFEDNSNLISPLKRPVKTSSQKRKYSNNKRSRDSEIDIEFTLSKKGPSMMENLIKQNNDKLRLYNKINVKKGKDKSPVKPCSVMMLRLEESFLGWDFVEIEDFSGFSEKDQTTSEENKEVFNKFLENERRDSESFNGWDLKKENFTGTTSLVPIGFMIDKLSES